MDETVDETALVPSNETSQEAVEALLARVRGLPDRRKLRAWLFPSAMTFAFVAALVGLGTMDYLESGWPVLAVLALTFGLGSWIWFLVERREMRSIKALADCRQLHTVGALLDCVNCSNRRVREAVQNTLLALLPRLTEGNSALLNTGQREAINALLYGKSGELAMAALSAIERIGDGTALPYLTSIAAGKGIPGALRDRRAEVQERAQYTVGIICGRIESQNRASVLLRASQVPGTPSEQLVRPAHGHSPEDGQELLRPEPGVEQDSQNLQDSQELIEKTEKEDRL